MPGDDGPDTAHRGAVLLLGASRGIGRARALAPAVGVCRAMEVESALLARQAMLTCSGRHEYAAAGILADGRRRGVVDADMQADVRASGLNPISRLPRSSRAGAEAPAAALAWLFGTRPADLAGQELDVRETALRERIAAAG